MPSPPRRATGLVRVRHVSGAEKWVRRARLQQVLAGGQWSRVPEPRPRKRPQRRTEGGTAAEPSTSAAVTGPAEPDTEKE